MDAGKQGQRGMVDQKNVRYKYAPYQYTEYQYVLLCHIGMIYPDDHMFYAILKREYSTGNLLELLLQ